MTEYFIAPNGELYHYGVKGQKWGVRRYQNADGTLTAAGKKRKRKDDIDAAKKANDYYKKKRTQADREYRNYLDKTFNPIDAPLWDKYLKSTSPGNVDDWYKKNVPADSKYWKAKEQETNLYNQWKKYDRASETTLAYIEHMRSKRVRSIDDPIVKEGEKYVLEFLNEKQK